MLLSGLSPAVFQELIFLFMGSIYGFMDHVAVVNSCRRRSSPAKRTVMHLPRALLVAC